MVMLLTAQMEKRGDREMGRRKVGRETGRRRRLEKEERMREGTEKADLTQDTSEVRKSVKMLYC